MKKIALPRRRFSIPVLLKTLLIMKFIILFILVSAIDVKAGVYAQNVTLRVQKTEIKKILNYIEKSSDIRFLYNYDLQHLLKEKNQL